jgi:hypothetical protein
MPFEDIRATGVAKRRWANSDVANYINGAELVAYNAMDKS